MDFKEFYKEIRFDKDNAIREIYQVTKGDTGSRGFLVTVYNKGVPLTIGTETMEFYAEKRDKTRVIINAVTVGNLFRIDLTNQVFAIPGEVKCELRLKGLAGEILSSKVFKMLVSNNLVDGSIISKDERGILDQAFSMAETLLPRFELIDVELLETYQARITNLEQDFTAHKEDYVNYIDSELDFVLRELPNGAKDEVRVSGGKAELVERVNKYVLESGDTMSIQDYTNVTLAFIQSIPNDCINFIATIIGQTTFNNMTQYPLSAISQLDNTAYIGGYATHNANNINYLRIVFPKGTTLAQAQTALVGTELTYQLAQPIITELALDDLSPNTQQIVKLTIKVEQLTKAIIALGGMMI